MPKCTTLLILENPIFPPKSNEISLLKGHSKSIFIELFLMFWGEEILNKPNVLRKILSVGFSEVDSTKELFWELYKINIHFFSKESNLYIVCI